MVWVLAAGLIGLAQGTVVAALSTEPALQPLLCPPSCNDGNFCTTDYCDPSDGLCHHVPLHCEDNNPCTTDTCTPTVGCQFQNHPNGEACTDDNACTVGDHCQGGNCVGSAVNCDDGNACTFDVCDNTGTGCGHYPLVCDDGNACTDDSCNPANGQCLNAPRPFGADCDDGNPCTAGTHCVAAPAGVACVGTVTPGAPCNDNQPCTTGDLCVSGMMGDSHCQGTFVNCDDGMACTSDYCDGTGQCHHDPMDCNDFNACTTDSCNAQTGCQHTPLPLQSLCDDSEFCTVNDRCVQDPQQGVICKGTPNLGVVCSDQNGCTYNDRCVAGGRFGGICQGTAIDCTDTDPCTNTFCEQATGQCRVSRQTCDDSNDCTTDSCTGQGCQNPPGNDGSACSDFNGCTTNDHCQMGFCAGTQLNCDDGNPCTDDACLESGCVHMPHNCADGNACTTDGCNPANGQCTHGALANGTVCTDNNPCTTNETCQAGSCIGSPVSCDDANPCTNDICDFMFGCNHGSLPDGTMCSDNNNCTVGDACASGQCVGQAINCSDGNPCTIESCNPVNGVCQHHSVLGEVTPVNFTTKTVFHWPTTTGGTHWNSYRGTIPAATLGSRLPGLVYNHVCFESADAQGDGPTQSTEVAKPPVGTAFYYDITEEGSCGEGPLGAASSGAVRPLLVPCPTPP